MRDLAGAVIDAAMRVHSAVGPGMLERVYVVCLVHELRSRGHTVATELPLRIVYDGVELDATYFLDLLVDDEVVVEVKAASRLVPVHRAQLLSYLRLSRHRVGLLINFNEIHLRDGIQRVVNGY